MEETFPIYKCIDIVKGLEWFGTQKSLWQFFQTKLLQILHERNDSLVFFYKERHNLQKNMNNFEYYVENAQKIKRIVKA